MLTDREFYAIVSRIPLDNEDRGKLYQYLAELGDGTAEDVEKVLKLIPPEANENNKLTDKNYVDVGIEEATDAEVNYKLYN